jgi:hypothetical protein
MSFNNYNIVFMGEILGDDINIVKSNMCKKFKCDNDIDYIFSGDKVILKRNLDQLKVADYIEIFEKIGMICHIEEANEIEKNSETPLLLEYHRSSVLLNLLSSSYFILSFFVINLIISLTLKNLSILMVYSLFSCIFLCHIIYMQKYTYNRIFLPNFWSINRIIGIIIAVVYFCFSIYVLKILPNLKFISEISPEYSYLSSGFIFILYLPILGILSMLYYDIIYTPENEMLRKGSNIASIIVGFYFIVLSVIILLSFL